MAVTTYTPLQETYERLNRGNVRTAGEAVQEPTRCTSCGGKGHRRSHEQALRDTAAGLDGVVGYCGECGHSLDGIATSVIARYQRILRDEGPDAFGDF